MLPDIVEYLVCPHCGQPLALTDGGGPLHCPDRHTFDVARQGYANLLPGGAHTGTGDTAAMVAAREAFLGAGHYAPIAAALARAVPDAAETVVDLGAGTGYYLAAVLDARPRAQGLALDISKFALRRAARAHPRTGAVVCDAWRPLPLRDAAASVVLNVFAPRNGPEIRRVLRPGGTLLVVSPTSRHLAELVGALGLLAVDARKQQRLAAALGPHLGFQGDSETTFPMELDHAAVRTVVDMGPSAWHTDAAELDRRIARLPDPVPATASVTLSRFTRPAPA
ncbi:putative RNA methyltransferase [Streptacidiphilus sp. P02-A3a]|uniref:putative RNA methyltransferase n=1 Tax=Streptacidiphilus sp. P02-A3a TaxID=2704468 RepID=UPI0015FB63B8|nr:methyltransferase domain-containing protein [Streptacidiphilus sp. P02-A3a]QMU72100.1 methyltransferase domain-containing protein [Streptacidiphilus sp. P02-A3a]